MRRKAIHPLRIGLGLPLAAAATLLAGCGDDGTGPAVPDEVPESRLTFLRPAIDAPPLETYDTTFVATAGQGLDVLLRYEPRPGESEGAEFLEFELDSESLARYPADHPTRPDAAFTAGDTVWIRIVVDPDQLIASFFPSGLQFSTLHPAQLEIRYRNADEDFDDDGDPDPELEDSIDLWRQESPGDPWQRVGELKDVELDGIRAFLSTFSRYGLAI